MSFVDLTISMCEHVLLVIFFLIQFKRALCVVAGKRNSIYFITKQRWLVVKLFGLNMLYSVETESRYIVRQCGDFWYICLFCFPN